MRARLRPKTYSLNLPATPLQCDGDRRSQLPQLRRRRRTRCTDQQLVVLQAERHQRKAGSAFAKIGLQGEELLRPIGQRTEFGLLFEPSERVTRRARVHRVVGSVQCSGGRTSAGEIGLQIIIVHPRLARARTLTLRPHWLVGAALAAILVVAASSGLLSYLTLRHAAELPPRLARALLAVRPTAEQPLAGGASAPDRIPQARLNALVDANDARSATDAAARQSIDALAVRLGELQARLARLDALGERVAGIVGVRAPETSRPLPGRGGALPSQSRSFTLGELSSAIDRVALGVERRGDHLGMIDSELLLREVMGRLLPTSQPLEDASPGSDFGWRIDPFNGRSTLHEGVDFNAPSGTPIVAAGAGIVVYSGWYPGYGRRVDIDHGAGVVTRYAHASRLLVKVGDIVTQGQKIAAVGSSGRSTGSHLHFEVRVNDEPLDPLQYLRDIAVAGSPDGPLAGVARLYGAAPTRR